MKSKQSISLFILALSLGTTLFSSAKNMKPAPDPADGKAVITDYINAIGGMDAIQKITSRKDSGSFSAQGMAFPIVQKYLAPNKTLQLVTMNGMTVSKTLFTGDNGYQEQMGNHINLEAADLADKKAQTAAVPQAAYVTNSAFKLSLQGTEKVDDKDAYKILITTPAGNTDTEYYEKSTKLLVKQILSKNVSGQSITIVYTYGDYRKVGDVLMSYKQTVSVSSGAINQSVDIALSEIKVNEGVTAADFQ